MNERTKNQQINHATCDRLSKIRPYQWHYTPKTQELRNGNRNVKLSTKQPIAYFLKWNPTPAKPNPSRTDQSQHDSRPTFI